MDSFEFNKIAGAVLASLLVLLGIGMFLAPTLYHAAEPEQQAYVVEGVEVEGEGAAAEAPAEQSIEELIQLATIERGQKVARRCVACHTFEQGGENKVGPNLYGTMGASKGHSDSFSYSAALLAKGGEWTWDNMNAFLLKPSDYIPGTAMSFAGLGKAEDRAAVMVYLASLRGTPYPKPEVAVAPAGEAPAEEAAAPADATDAAADAPAADDAGTADGDDMPGRNN
jgi:cytochrome c